MGKHQGGGGEEREAKRERSSESGRALAAELSQRRVATSVVAARVGAQGRGKQRRRERIVETQGRATQRAVPTHTHTHTPSTGELTTQSGTRVRRTQAEARSLPEQQGRVGGEASGRSQAHVHKMNAAQTPRARLAPPGTRRAAKESAARALCVTCGRCLRCRSLLASSKASSSLSASAYALLLSTSTLTSPPLDAMGRSARKRDFA